MNASTNCGKRASLYDRCAKYRWYPPVIANIRTTYDTTPMMSAVFVTPVKTTNTGKRLAMMNGAEVVQTRGWRSRGVASMMIADYLPEGRQIARVEKWLLSRANERQRPGYGGPDDETS